MPTPSRQLLSRTIYDTDGVTVNWGFSFSGGYIDRGHVKAYVDLPTGERTELTVTPGMFIGPYQLAITPAILSGCKLTIYRDTPKGAPLVDFTDGAGFSEASMDITAKQAVFVSAESVDTLNTSSNYEASVAATAAYASQLAAAASALAAQTQATASAASASAASSAAASINPAAFATAAQGVKADSALQPVAAQAAAYSIATVGGTADALTLTFTPAWVALHGGIFQFVAVSDNATATPTGNPNTLGTKTFIKGNNLALAPGDIKSGMTMLARYDSVLGKLVLLNPFTSLIVETGSNANGSYTKWADGTMICEHRQTISASIGNAFTGGGFYSGGIGWTFPVPFVGASTPVCHVTAYGLASFGAVIATTPVNTDMQYVHLSIGSLGATNRFAMLTAKGRWY